MVFPCAEDMRARCLSKLEQKNVVDGPKAKGRFRMLFTIRCSFSLAPDLTMATLAAVNCQTEHLASTSKRSNGDYNTLYLQQFMPLARPPTLFSSSMKCDCSLSANSESSACCGDGFYVILTSPKRFCRMCLLLLYVRTSLDFLFGLLNASIALCR